VTFGVAVGALTVPSALVAAITWLPMLSVAAKTPAAAMAPSAIRPIAAVIRPVRKLISSSRALTA